MWAQTMGVKNNVNTRNFVNTSCTSSSQSVLDSESFDSNTSTSFVNIAIDDVVTCNTLKSLSNNTCNVTKYSNLDGIDSYKSICSSEVSLATVSRHGAHHKRSQITVLTVVIGLCVLLILLTLQIMN